MLRVRLPREPVRCGGVGQCSREATVAATVVHMGHVFAVRTCRARGSREFSVQPGMVCQGHRRVGGAHVCVQVFVVCRLRLYMVAPKRKLDGKACKFAMLSDIFGKVCRAGAAEPSSYKDLRDGKHRRPPLSASEAQRLPVDGRVARQRPRADNSVQHSRCSSGLLVEDAARSGVDADVHARKLSEKNGGEGQRQLEERPRCVVERLAE